MRWTPIIHTLRSDGTYTTAAALALDTGATPTFARNCTAYRDYWDGATRKIASVAANVPRWCTRKDADGTLRSGLLIEAETTNQVIRSELDANWGCPSRCTLETSALASPDGGVMKNIRETGLTGATYAAESTTNITLAQGGLYVCSFFARAMDRSWCLVDFYHNTGGGTAAGAWFNLGTGQVGSTIADSGVTATGMENWGGGLYRCHMAFTQTVNATAVTRIWSCLGDGQGAYTGTSGKDAIAIWGFQVGTGSFPSSYIKTAGAPVTRLKDDLSYAVTGKIGTRGSLVYSFLRSSHDLGVALVPASLHDGSADNRITSSILATGDKLSTTVVSGGVTQADITDSTTDIVDGNKHIFAISWEPNSIKQYVNGSAEGTADTSATIPSGITTLTLADSAAANQGGGLISDLKLYNRPGVTS